MKRLLTTVIFMLVCSLAFSACTLMPYVGVELPEKDEKTFTVYVCGAVEREGYFTVRAGLSYTELITRAGILPQSYLPVYYTDTVTESTKVIVVDYYDGTKQCYCTNANSPEITARNHIDGLPDEVVSLVADYIEAHGTVHNKTQLYEALGEFAEEYIYRFFVAEADYEETC